MYSVDVIAQEEVLPVGLIYMEGFPSSNRCSVLIDELIRTGMAHKAATFVIIKVKDFHFEVPLKDAFIRIEPYLGARTDVLEDDSCPTFLPASAYQKLKHWLLSR